MKYLVALILIALPIYFLIKLIKKASSKQSRVISDLTVVDSTTYRSGIDNSSSADSWSGDEGEFSGGGSSGDWGNSGDGGDSGSESSND